MVELLPGEKILFVARIHWLINFVDGISHFLIGIMPTVIYLIFIPGAGIVTPTINLLLILICVKWFAYAWIHFFFAWTDYHLDVWLITNKRIVDVEQNGMFSRKVSSAHYEQIQDVTVNVSGLINTLLKLGDIHVQTAGEKREFVLKSMGNPMNIKNIITKIQRNVIEQ